MPAIAPPTEEQIGAVGIAPTAVPASSTADMHTLYEDAVNSGNPANMYSLTARAKGTPYESVIRKSAETMNRYVSEFEKDVKPIREAGGVGTPSGNIAAAKVYETIADHPEKGRALFEWLIGNKDWSKFITGGKPTTSLGYDRNGKQLERTVNELGQTISVRDAGTRQLLTPDEVEQRGGFLSSLDNAIGFQQQKELARANTAGHIISNEMARIAEATAPVQREAAKEGGAIFKQLYDLDLTPEQRKQIGLFSSEQTSRSQNRSAGLTALSQAINSTDNKVGAEYAEALKPMLAGMGLKLSADRTIQNSSGKSLNKSELENLQKTLHEGTEAQSQFTRDAKTFLENKVFNNLKPEERALLGRALDLQFAIEKTNANMGEKRLPFLKNPAAFKIGDEFNRAEAGMLAHEFNAEAMDAYAKWRKNELANYTAKGLLPQPMELEAAFARSDEYKALAASFAARTKEMFSRPAPKGRPQEPAANTPSYAETRAAELGIAEQPVTPSPALLERKFSRPKVAAPATPAAEASTGLLPSEGETATSFSRNLKRPSMTELLKKHGGR